jgi:hypothetical protein
MSSAQHSSIYFFHKFFVRIYSWYMGGFIVTITIRLVLVWSPPSYPSSPHLKQLQEISLFYFIYEVHQRYTVTFISFFHPSPSYYYHPHILYLFYSPVFCYWYLNWCSNGFLKVCPLWVYFTLVCSTPAITLPYPFTSPPPFSTSFTTHPYIFYLHILYFTTLLMLYHSLFPFLLSLNSIEYFHYWNRVLHLSCMIRLVFVYMFIFWIYLRHMRENMWPLCFWAWLTSLNMISSNCFHLPSNICHYSLWVKLHYIYIYHIFLIHLSVIGHQSCFQSLDIANSAAMNIGVQVSLLYPVTFLWVNAQEWYHWIIRQFYL